MSLINKKAFFLVETIVVISIVGIVVTFLFKNFTKLFTTYNGSQNYNTVSAINATSYVKKYIDSMGIEYDFILGTNDYVDITNSSLLENDYFNSLKDNSSIQKIFLINLTTFFDDQSNLNNFNIVERGYLKTLENENSYYMLIVETDDNQFGSLSVYDYYLKLFGNSSDEYAVYVEQDAEYFDTDYEAKDSIGNNLDVYKTGFLDTTILGNYYLNYSVGKIQKSRKVVVIPENEYDIAKGVNRPKLNMGMVPVKWSGSSWEKTTYDDPDWYDYTAKKWANAMTEDGSLWVWIPRYVYRITSGWHSNTAGTIDIQFSIETDDTRGGTVTLDTGTTSNASNNKWTNHPGFTFGSTELTGIWVAKFETSVSDQTDSCYSLTANELHCNKTSLVPKIIPNAYSWRYISIGNAFSVTRLMETYNSYGWGTSGDNIDTHLMKNTEWGAVAYLSKSIYGKNTTEVWINNSQTYTTGCAGNAASSMSYNGCENSYETANGVNASTTGTIYGVYDMSGGAWELVASHIDSDNVYIEFYGDSLNNSNSNYKNLYPVGTTDTLPNNYIAAINVKGDALYETSNNTGAQYSWNSDYAYMCGGDYPFIMRGGKYNAYDAGGVFNFYNTRGGYSSSDSFRPTLLVEDGL